MDVWRPFIVINRILGTKIEGLCFMAVMADSVVPWLVETCQQLKTWRKDTKLERSFRLCGKLVTDKGQRSHRPRHGYGLYEDL